jgi:hypothetical protein
MTNETTTKCPGCWEDDCIDCNGTSAEQERWDSMPSKIHGQRAAAASEKQLNFIKSLIADKDVPAAGKTTAEARLIARVEDVMGAKSISKSEASDVITWLKGLPNQGGKTGATEKQESFLRSLIAQKLPDADADGLLATLTSPAMASALIDSLKAAPRPEQATSKSTELEDGIYRNTAGEIFKVYHTVHGANQQVAKKLVISGDEGRFEYVGKSGLRGLTSEHKMTLEQAKEFGQVYGMCCSCGATLTNETSIEAGIGPICAAKF